MKVLLLTQFYWPETRSAPTNLAAVAEFLQERGHQVQVITGFPNHPVGRVYDGYKMRWRQWDDVRGVGVLRLPLYTDHSLSARRRAAHYSSFALSSATLGTWLTRNFRPDVILVYLPPLTNWLPIRALKLIHRAPVVYWITDLWPEALDAVGAPLKPWMRKAIQRLDRAVNRQAALICVNSPGIEERLIEKGIERDRLEVITDWADENLFFPVEPDPSLAREHGLAGKFNIVYGGTLGPAQGLETVLDAASLLRDLVDLQFVLIGAGEDAARLEMLAKEQKIGNVHFIPHQPMSEIHRFYAIADVLFTHLKPDPMFERQIPSKIMAYLACGRPILCGITGSAAAVVRDSGAGLCCAPGDPRSLSAAVRQLYEMPSQERARLGANGRSTYLKKYTREVQASRIESLLMHVANASTT